MDILISAIGTGISLYGLRGPVGGTLNLLFDGAISSVNLNSTEELEDGDHQIIGTTSAAMGQAVANIWLDYFE